MDIQRLFHTVRYLRLQQLTGRIVHRLHQPRPDLRPAPAHRRVAAPWTPAVSRAVSMLAPDRFRFLNSEHTLCFPAAWNDPALPKLWLYNLHYFDDLNAEGADAHRDRHAALIARWIAENPPGAGNGWEPYPLSLRIVNWIKWVLAGNELPPDALHSLAIQARFLRKRLEYHLLGNHLWANAKALVFAGLFCDGPEADGWLDKGLEILAREIPEQILPDGGHFERSPMYHAIILDDLLDLVNLSRTFGREVPAVWLDAIARMRRWLVALTHPDGRIALFNDAAFGVAPEPAALEAYAERLGLPDMGPISGGAVRLGDTGYLRVKAGHAVAFLDVAPVGPDYIPGHAHADTLGFELSLSGRRVIVDSGTSTYEKNVERQRQRGTAAHNTVTIDGADSSEVWGGFRVARRARPFDLRVEDNSGDVFVSCAHDGYRRLPGRPVHRRDWRLTADALQVCDRIEGAFQHAVARYHFHPDVTVELDDPTCGRGTLADGRHFYFRVGKGVATLANTTYHPEFNVSIANQCLELTFAGPEACVVFEFQPLAASR
ncbi:MAG: heparinase [Deltaproteobacteria bacterium]|nr:MAG: heparinase [Deltaproteobacteria bacterium]